MKEIKHHHLTNLLNLKLKRTSLSKASDLINTMQLHDCHLLIMIPNSYVNTIKLEIHLHSYLANAKTNAN